jgi:hypothetical protein
MEQTRGQDSRGNSNDDRGQEPRPLQVTVAAIKAVKMTPELPQLRPQHEAGVFVRTRGVRSGPKR